MQTLSRKVIFTVGEREFSGEDVVQAAKFWSDWAKLEQNVRYKIACLKKMEESEDFPDEDEFTSAATEFRYARDLLTAEETEKWLEDRDLTYEVWWEHIQRSVLVKKWSDTLIQIAAEFPVKQEEVEAIIEAEAICSREFDRFARKLAGRAAIYESKGNVLSAKAYKEMSEMLAELEESFQDYCKETIIPETIQEEIRLHSLDWIRFGLQILSFPEKEMAQEAAFCVREDGRSFERVAYDAKVLLEYIDDYLDQLDASLQEALFGAQKGDLIGPLHLHDQHVLVLVTKKVMPSIENPETQRKAEEDFLRRALENEINNRVKGYLHL